MPGSGPRRHDARQRLIAPLARRGTLLPPLHRCCPGDAERAGNAGDHAKLTPSTAAATTQAATQPNPHRRQPAQPAPAGSFLGGFRTPAAAPVDRSRPAGIRNPTPTGLILGPPVKVGKGAQPAVVIDLPERVLLGCDASS